LITGCGRSGTKYITFLLRRLGLDVRHERMGEDGIASWYMTADTDHSPFGPARRAASFEHIYQQVRHPLPVIASAATFKPHTWQFICEHTPIRMEEPLPVRCAKYWYYWNLEAEKIAEWRYRVEHLNDALTMLCKRLGIESNGIVLDRVDTDVNTRKRGRAFHLYEELCERLRLEPSAFIKRCLTVNTEPKRAPPLTWDALKDVDVELVARIRAKAQEYGYEQ
jgi:hypothetical protein